MKYTEEKKRTYRGRDRSQRNENKGFEIVGDKEAALDSNNTQEMTTLEVTCVQRH